MHDLSAIIQTFREKKGQPERLVNRLRDIADLRIQILINDDSGEQREAWQRLLRPNDVYMSSANVHEVRAYNRLAKEFANASILVFLQGDNCLPVRSFHAGGLVWVHDALYLFDRLPRLGVLGGHVGFDGPSLATGFGPYPRRMPIPFFVQQSVAAAEEGRSGNGSAGKLTFQGRPLAFAHVYGVNIGPYFVRRRAFLSTGGFTERYSAAGEPGGHFDVELCTRLWIEGRFTCGVYYGGVGNGVGGHKTRQGVQARLRKRNQERAFVHLWKQWKEHNGTIGAHLTRENGALQALRPRRARAMQQAKPESARSCGGKH